GKHLQCTRTFYASRAKFVPNTIAAGPTRRSRWCATRHLAALGVSSVKGEPGLARVRSNLNGYSICQDLTGDKRLDLAWTYETQYECCVAADLCYAHP